MEAVQGWRFESAILFFTAAAYLLAAIFSWTEMFTKKDQVRGFGFALSLLGLGGNVLALVLSLINFDTSPITLEPYRLINSNQFLLTFSCFTVLLHMLLAWRYNFHATGIFIMPLVFGLLIYGLTAGRSASGEFAAFMVYNSWWLLLYVLTSALAYASFAISFGLGVMYLVKNYLHSTNPRGNLSQKLPALELVDDLGYRQVLHGFPFFSASLIIGAVWAHHAWGTYWSWEPKETWSFISWLAFVAYLHARLLYGWKGNRSAWMTVMGFLAVLFTFIGVSYFLPGQNVFSL